MPRDSVGVVEDNVAAGETNQLSGIVAPSIENWVRSRYLRIIWLTVT
jgi:hypothetical protein